MRGQCESLDPGGSHGQPSFERTVAVCKKVRPPSSIELPVIDMRDMLPVQRTY